MPSGEPKVPEQGFRRRVVGGFDENDVLAYVNALVNESQQQQMEYEEQIKQLQGQIDKMKKEQANARACVEKLQDELLQQTQRAEKAESDHAESEKKLAESMEQYSVSESRATGYQGKYRQSQKTLLEWQTRCQQAEEELSQLRAELAARPEKPAPAQPETPAPAPAAPAPEPVQTPVPAPAPEPAPQPVSTPSIEARKILADARIYAENAERRMRREAEEQKQRMAENAKDLAAGVMVLRERLSRVDEKLSAAALDLENATAAIYAALDHTDADLESLGVKLNDFAQGTPETDLPADPEEPEQPAPPPPQPPAVPVPSALAAGMPAAAPASRSPERLRPAAAPASAPAARRVRPVPKAKPAPPPPKRLRRSVHSSGSGRRAVAQSLLDAINRMSGDDK